MDTRHLSRRHACMLIVAGLGALLGSSRPVTGQSLNAQPIHFKASGAAQKLEMIVNTSRILTLEHNVPRLLVQNPDIIQASPLSPNQIQLSALRPGVTSVNVWDENNRVNAITVRVYGDVRELQDTLTTLFPGASIQARPLNSSIVLRGHVPTTDQVNQVIEVSREYFPKVINQMTVGGTQTVALHVKVLEVSRTKLREFGIDWSLMTGGGFVTQAVSGVTALNSTLSFGIISNGRDFTALMRLLAQNNLSKLLAEPTLVAISGRPASFNSGGEVPVPISGGLGVTSVEYREFGTTVDFVPIVLGNGKIRLEVRPTVTEIDESLTDTVTGTPGFRSRRVDTGVEMEPGQTLALAGLIQNRVSAEKRGIPWLGDLPWIGAAFRSTEERVNEVELMIFVTPEIVAPMDPHEVPRCGPGESTASPTDVELYFRGYIETPRCCTDGRCPKCVNGQAGMMGGSPYASGMPYEEVAPRDAQQGTDRQPYLPTPKAAPQKAAPPNLPPQSRLPALQDPQPADPGAGLAPVPTEEASSRSSARRFRPISTRGATPILTRTPAVRQPYERRQQNSYGRNNVTRRNGNAPVPNRISDPGLIGPVGYDVIK